MEDTQVHALDYVSVLRRRKWWLVVPIVASIGIGALLVRFLPKQAERHHRHRGSGRVAETWSARRPPDSNERMRVRRSSAQLARAAGWRASRLVLDA